MLVPPNVESRPTADLRREPRQRNCKRHQPSPQGYGSTRRRLEAPATSCQVHGSLLQGKNNLASTRRIKTGRHGWIAWLVSRQRELAVLKLVNCVSRLANILWKWTIGHHSNQLLWGGVFAKCISSLIPLLRIWTVKLQLRPIQNNRRRTLGLGSNLLPAPCPLNGERIRLG